MQHPHPFFSHVFQTLRQAPRRSQTLWTLCALITFLLLWSSVETVRLVLADLNSPFVGYLEFALLLQVLMWKLFFDKILKLTCIQPSPSANHNSGPTE